MTAAMQPKFDHARTMSISSATHSIHIDDVHNETVRPKLMFFGDPHSDCEFVIRSAKRHKPEAIVLLGDIQARRPLQIELAPLLNLTELCFIHGNHGTDTDSEADHDNLFGSQLAHRNLHGRVTEIAGFRVAGLGGVFRGSIWAPPFTFVSVADRLKVIRPAERWRGGLPLRHRSSIFPDEYQRLSRQHADVLVTHEALGGHPHGLKSLDNLATAMRVQVAVHGHLHRTIDCAAEGRLDPPVSYLAFGVAREQFLIWPRDSLQLNQGLQ
jgi:predicted phosphodiesterase